MRAVRTAHVGFGMFDFSFVVVAGPKLSPETIHILSEVTSISKEIVQAELDVECRGYILHRQGHGTAIWLPRVPRSAQDYATLAHETFHAVCHMTRHFGVEFAKESEETFAHALSYAVRETITQLKAGTAPTKEKAMSTKKKPAKPFGKGIKGKPKPGSDKGNPKGKLGELKKY